MQDLLWCQISCDTLASASRGPCNIGYTAVHILVAHVSCKSLSIYCGVSSNLRTDGEGAALDCKNGCGCQVEASCAVWNIDRIVHTVKPRSDSLTRTEVEKGDVVTIAHKSEDRLIRLNCHRPYCQNWTPIRIRPSVDSKRQYSCQRHCDKQNSHCWVSHADYAAIVP